MTEMLEKALSVSRDLGLPVFPCVETCDQNGKVSKRPYTKNGFKAATLNEVQIAGWWEIFPNALIGVPTGKNTGLFVIDIDQSDSKNGEASFAELEIDDPITCQTRTVSGGRHIIFKYPQAQKLTNSAGNLLGRHIDTRGEGGYVIWAGSKTELGAYTYREGYLPEDVGFSELPERLLNILLSKERKVHSSQYDKATIENGARNETLFQEAVTLVHSGVSEQDIRDHIEARAKDCVERLDITELENILTSALRYRRSTSIPFTDLGNGERFVSDHAGDAIYCSDQKA